MRVSIHLEDVENDTVAMRADFYGGKRDDSAAHAMAVQLIKFLEDRLSSGHELVEETVPIEPSRMLHG